MNAETLIRVVVSFVSGVLFYWIVLRPILKPALSRMNFNRRLNKRIKILKKAGIIVEMPIRDPNLSQEELELLQSDEIPLEEHIWKYYQMYCKKFEMDNSDTWTTLKPMPFEDWEKRAKTPTKRIQPKEGDFGFQVAGGYQYIIPMTCDTMIGMPPMQVYMRHHDYAGMVEADNQSFVEELESAETE